LRALFVSQDLSDIRRQLGRAATLTLKAQDTKHDINAYVTFWADEVRLKFKLDDEAIPQMIGAVTSKANGKSRYISIFMLPCFLAIETSCKILTPMVFL
jgi:hypothetical protein